VTTTPAAVPDRATELARPGVDNVPRHVAIIMDGNGRWARRRRLPRIAGHRRGAEAVRASVRACDERGIEYLTLFAFSSENWRRPAEEVALLMRLFRTALEREVDELHRNGVRLKVVGDTARFDPKIRELIETRVRPAVAQDGGDIIYRGYKDGHLYLAMQGACHGCPSSELTLKRGIENLIRHYVPEVETVEAV